MRVMQLTTDLRLGGAERVIVNLVRCLRQEGVECAVAGLYEGGQRPATARLMLQEAGFEVYSAGLERKHMLWRLGGLRRFVSRWRPDLLHCHLFHGNAAGALLRVLGLKCPVVWTHHAVEPRPRPLRAAFYRVFRGVPQCHVFVSEAAQQFQHAWSGAAPREEVVYNGIELGPYLDVQPRPGPVFGALGRLAPQKGLDLLICAFARLCRENDEVRLTVGGAGRDRALLERLIRAEGLEERVSLIGFVHDVPAFLGSVNVFVMPSRWEPFGLSLLEAMAAGLPCIASRVGGMPEVGGELVEWVEPGDVEGLHTAMRRLASVAESPERVARQREAVMRFSRERMTQDYLLLYRELLGNRGLSSKRGEDRSGS